MKVDYLVTQFCNGYKTIFVFCFYLSQFWKTYFSRNPTITLKFSKLIGIEFISVSIFTKRNEIGSFVETWVDLETVRQSEERKKNIYPILMHICGI